MPCQQDRAHPAGLPEKGSLSLARRVFPRGRSGVLDEAWREFHLGCKGSQEPPGGARQSKAKWSATAGGEGPQIG